MHRSSRSHLFILTLGTLLLLPAVGFLWLRLTMPFDNGRLQPGADHIQSAGLIVTPVDAAPAALQPGDVVTHVDGRRLEFWAEALFEAGSPRPRWRAGDTVGYTVLRDGEALTVNITLARYPLGQIARRNWGTILFAVVFFSLAAYVLARRPEARVAQPLFLSAAAVLSSTTWSLGLQVSDFVAGTPFWLFQFTTIIAFNLFWIAGLHFALVFPRPLPVVRQRWLVPALYVVPYLFLLLYLLVTYFQAPDTLDWIRLWGPTTGLHGAVFMALMLAAVVWQYRRHPQGVYRQQLRWLTLAVIVSGGAGLAFYLLPPLFGRPAVDSNLIGAIILTFPAALAVAILRHNLFDIDTLLNRTMVYGALTAVTVAVYIIVVTGLGAMLQARADWFTSLLATGVVAVLFQPLRERLQRAVNRFLYGERDEPFEVLSRLGRRLEETLSADGALSTIVETVAQALKLPYVALALPGESELETAVGFGRPLAHTVAYPLLHQNEPIGQLLVAPRAPDEPFSATEERLLRSLARQAGTIVHTVRLTRDLQGSRRRLVTAREEERRRLRRDLHDGLGPTLAAHLFKLGSTRATLERDTAAADRLLAELENETEHILVEIRRLVYDLRPPVLDQLGLLGAIDACVAQYRSSPATNGGLTIDIHAPDQLPSLPAAVEVAAYRIVQEAVTNVVRHAEATHCQIELTYGGGLQLSISDNGRGIPRDHRIGVGLASMRERAAELGGRCTVVANPAGGTMITAVIPL